jgi:hypothetical protein
MFRSYDHHQEENILIGRITQLTADPITWSHTRNSMQTPKIKTGVWILVLCACFIQGDWTVIKIHLHQINLHVIWTTLKWDSHSIYIYCIMYPCNFSTSWSVMKLGVNIVILPQPCFQQLKITVGVLTTHIHLLQGWGMLGALPPLHCLWCSIKCSCTLTAWYFYREWAP